MADSVKIKALTSSDALTLNGQTHSYYLDANNFTNMPPSDLSGDTTPQLGGNLDLNSNNVTGTGNINVTGTITGTSFSGPLTGNVTGNVTGDVTGNITGVAATFSGNVSIAGTLTYEDVTNIDSLGIVTARTGVRVSAGGLTVTGVSTFNDNIVGDNSTNISGISSVTATSFFGTLTGAASNITVLTNSDDATRYLTFVSGTSGNRAPFVNTGLTYNPNKSLVTVNGTIAPTQVNATGVITASSFSGDGSALTGIEAGITTTASSPSANTVVTLNLSTAQHHQLTLSAGITTITCSGGSFGDSHSVVVIQPSSGIATVGFSTYFLFPSGSAPAMSEGSGKTDLISFVVKTVGGAGFGTELLASAGLDYQ